LYYIQLECCGVSSYADWANQTVAPIPSDQPLIPESCCIGGEHEKCTESITLANVGDIDTAKKVVFVNVSTTNYKQNDRL